MGIVPRGVTVLCQMILPGPTLWAAGGQTSMAGAFETGLVCPLRDADTNTLPWSADRGRDDDRAGGGVRKALVDAQQPPERQR